MCLKVWKVVVYTLVRQMTYGNALKSIIAVEVFILPNVVHIG